MGNIDSLDKAILWCLLDTPKSIWEIANQIFDEAEDQVKQGKKNDYELRKMCERIRYRLSRMKADGIIVKNRRDSKYTLENVTVGSSVVRLTPDEIDLDLEDLVMGKTIAIPRDSKTELIFLEDM